MVESSGCPEGVTVQLKGSHEEFENCIVYVGHGAGFRG